MLEKKYSKLGEAFFSKTLANGLTVFLLPKADFHKTHAIFSTNYGSIDNQFTLSNTDEVISVPDGIAHFLEHKLFDKENTDISLVFAKQGASSNAFTSFTKTSYFFSTIENVYQNLELLLDFVQTPYFSKQSIEKEKGIITQEIQMYQDDPDWRLFFGLLNNLYPNQSLSIDIAGTPESIRKITPEDLYLCYHTFYHPSNMILFVTGPFDVERMMSFIQANQAKKTFPKATAIQKNSTIAKQAIVAHDEIKMEIITPKLIIGFKGNDDLANYTEKELITYKLAISFALKLLFTVSSANYQELYHNSLIDESFYADFSLERSFHFIEISSDTEYPKELSKILRKKVTEYKTAADWNAAHLERIKKNALGKLIMSLDNLGYLANQFSQNLYPNTTFLDLPEIIQEITLAEIEHYLEIFLKHTEFADFTIFPKD
ncbi:MAG: insulinase family protein [Streptococcaceae bacterium]|jgi:predicted Zn-dependent peptidase|nr:insulinase family protein [Streptococcaceae bacterium]